MVLGLQNSLYSTHLEVLVKLMLEQQHDDESEGGCEGAVEGLAGWQGNSEVSQLCLHSAVSIKV